MAMSKFMKKCETVHDEGKTSRLNKISMASRGIIRKRPIASDRFFTSRKFFAGKPNHKTESGMMPCHVPDDDSSLFTSIYFLISNGLCMNTSYQIVIRKMITEGVIDFPERYTTAFLGMSPQEYCQWVMTPSNGPRAIELMILSERLQTEIIVLDCFTLTTYQFGENHHKRLFLLHNDGHFDPLVYEQNGIWRTIFPACQDVFLKMAQEAAQEVKILFTLYCPACNALLHGDKEARAHVRATGHREFEELAV